MFMNLEVIEPECTIKHRGHNLEYSISNMLCNNRNPHIFIIVGGYRWWQKCGKRLKRDIHVRTISRTLLKPY